MCIGKRYISSYRKIPADKYIDSKRYSVYQVFQYLLKIYDFILKTYNLFKKKIKNTTVVQRRSLLFAMAYRQHTKSVQN